ncbi:uncharacterized protein EI90DRAFT_2988811 [Cantharellus anzutake]|uniref:uncharacterized protein n=1 Tax=Cantharellus anzutake TaxID=1750568 RepID=UPI001907270A|nr:uncharacterized protein EI90DRAFT_2988811 [Cantharellus anzutake]KAF8342295.1 hypothetical protein EI90DRAFT_2988811 [Cantharellus anzutake]
MEELPPPLSSTWPVPLENIEQNQRWAEDADRSQALISDLSQRQLRSFTASELQAAAVTPPANGASFLAAPVPFPLATDTGVTHVTAAPAPLHNNPPEFVPTTPRIDSSSLLAMPHHVDPLQIVLSEDNLICRGVGSSMDDALLSGNLVLNLAESTSIKEINMQFIGKVTLPVGEALPSVAQPTSHTIYTHSWTFMEHKHTIREGRQVFPFQHLVPASLPASMSIPRAGVDVSYALRATAVRSSSFHSNWTAVRPVYLMRMFDPEAIEFGQVMEVENTWPGKITYSLLIPHKAFAVGDTIPTLVKFQPISKGVSVKSIDIELKERVSARWKNRQSSTLTIMSHAKYEVRDGKAVKVQQGGHVRFASIVSCRTQPPYQSLMPMGSTSADHSSESSSSGSRHLRSRSSSFRGLLGFRSHSSGHVSALSSIIQGASPMVSASANRRRGGTDRTFSLNTMFGGEIGSTENEDSPSPSGEIPSGSPRIGEHASSQPLPSPETQHISSPAESPPLASPLDEVPVSCVGESDLETTLFLHLTSGVSPSQSSPFSHAANPTNILNPIAISHKIIFSVLISNLDGHTSELKCSLPLHILDARLLRGARAATRTTRNLLLGNGEGAEEGLVGEDEGEEVVELPSYNEHILDRVANASLEAGIGGNGRRRARNVATNPLRSAPSPVGAPASNFVSSTGGFFGPHPSSSYDNSSRASPSASVPRSPARSRKSSFEEAQGLHQDRDPLEFDQELMLSLGEAANSVRYGDRSGVGWGSNYASPSTSRMGSRANSRAGSPEPPDEHHVHPSHGRHHPHSTASTASSSTTARGLFHLKPFSSLTRLGGQKKGKERDRDRQSCSSPPSPTRSSALSPSGNAADDECGPHYHSHINLLSRVPSYGISSRGFLGGGPPPLTFYRDLPSYDQSESASSSAHPVSSFSPGTRSTVLDRSRSEACIDALRATGTPVAGTQPQTPRTP